MNTFRLSNDFPWKRLLCSSIVHWSIPDSFLSVPHLTHWGWVAHIWDNEWSIFGSDIGLSPGRRQAINWTNAGILLIEPLGTNFSEKNSIEIDTSSFMKMHFKMSFGNAGHFVSASMWKQTYGFTSGCAISGQCSLCHECSPAQTCLMNRSNYTATLLLVCNITWIRVTGVGCVIYH